MTPNNYQKFVLGLLSPQSRADQLINATLGLVGEAGEFADMVKKHKHHGHEFERQKAILELGDILFYVAEAADELNATLEEVMMQNVAKLTKRYPSGKFTLEDSITKKDAQQNEDTNAEDSGGTEESVGGERSISQ